MLLQLTVTALTSAFQAFVAILLLLFYYYCYNIFYCYRKRTTVITANVLL